LVTAPQIGAPFAIAGHEPSGASRRSPCWSYVGGRAECAEHRWLLEGGDVDQAAVVQAQHGEHEQEERPLAGTAEIPGGTVIHVYQTVRTRQ